MASAHPPRVDPAPLPPAPPTLRLMERAQHPRKGQALPPPAWHARLGRWLDRLIAA